MPAGNMQQVNQQVGSTTPQPPSLLAALLIEPSLLAALLIELSLLAALLIEPSLLAALLIELSLLAALLIEGWNRVACPLLELEHKYSFLGSIWKNGTIGDPPTDSLSPVTVKRPLVGSPVPVIVRGPHYPC
jgi:hypothetical protein